MSWILEADSRYCWSVCIQNPTSHLVVDRTDLHVIELEWCVPPFLARYSSFSLLLGQS